MLSKIVCTENFYQFIIKLLMKTQWSGYNKTEICDFGFTFPSTSSKKFWSSLLMCQKYKTTHKATINYSMHKLSTAIAALCFTRIPKHFEMKQSGHMSSDEGKPTFLLALSCASTLPPRQDHLPPSFKYIVSKCHVMCVTIVYGVTYSNG